MSTQPGTLLIRADANVAMGTGHVMRCLALAQAWQDAGGRAVFLVAEVTAPIGRRLLDEGLDIEHISARAGSLEDAEETASIARGKLAVWVITDGYQFGAEYQRRIKGAGLRLLFVDDEGRAEHYCADLVLNQNLRAASNLYPHREPYTKLLLGPRYALLRREFRQWRHWQRETRERATKILVTMGGSDPHNVTAKAIEAICQLSDASLKTTVLTGGSNPHRSSLEGLICRKDPTISLIHDAPNVAELMAGADVAIAGAGTTFWEMCALGLPSILLVLAENQRLIAGEAERFGAAESLGDAAKIGAPEVAAALRRILDSPPERTARSSRARALVDGRGAERVVAFLSDLKLRRSVESDCKIFWEWANDPGTRFYSFNSEPISWEEHVEWFRAKLADPNTIFYTATDAEGLPLGEVRFQIDSTNATLSISLGSAFRKRGLGRKILDLAAEQVFHDCGADFIHAYVKPGNERSVRLFGGSDFQCAGSKIVDGQEAVHFVLRRPYP